MPPILIAVLCGFFISLCLAVALYLRLQKAELSQQLVQQQLAAKDEYAAKLQEIIDAEQLQNNDLQQRLEDELQEKTKSVTRLETLLEQNQQLLVKIAETESQHQEAQRLHYEAQKQVELMHQRLEANSDRIKEREEHMQNAKAAIFEAGGQLTKQLIEQHKQEMEAGKKESKTTIEEATNKFYEQYENLFKHISSLESKVKAESETVDTVRRALLSPTGAGSLAEITLENIFIACNLKAGQDYVMQYSIPDSGEGRLRPDAVLFLSAGHIMVIDSKASKFFLEMAEAAEGQEKEMAESLKMTMRSHLKSLASKDYKESIRQHLQRHYPDRDSRDISLFMFIPTEAALEKIHINDKQFREKAWEWDIHPIGPSGLVNQLAYKRFQIAQENQEKNYENICDEVKKLLASLAVMQEHAAKIGRGLQSAAQHYDKFAGSYNSNVLPKARAIQKLGITLPQNKALPPSLERYQLINAGMMIEGEAEEALPELTQIAE